MTAEGRAARIPVRDWARAIGLLVLILIPMFIWRYRWRVPIDLAVYRAGGSAVLHGKTLYGAAFGGNTLPVRRPFTYPPFSAIAFISLAVLPWIVAAVAWFFASLGSLVYIVKESFAPFLRRFDRRRSLYALVCIIGLLAWTVPITDTLWFSQINLILAALVLTDCLHARKRQGVLVGLATALKITPGLFIVYFLITRQKRAALRAMATVAACWGGAAILLPAASREYWSHAVFKVGRPGPLAFFSNQTINGFVHRLNGPHWLWIPLGVVVAAVGLWRARAAHRSGNALAAVVLVGLTMLIVSPISWLASAVWIAPAIGLILGDATQRRRVIAAGSVLVLFWARLPMLGDKIVRVHPIPFLGSALENAYVFLLLLLVLLLPHTDAPKSSLDGSPREGSNQRRILSGKTT